MGVLSMYAVLHVCNMKTTGHKAADIFTLSHQYCGYAKPKWCIYYGETMVGHADTKRDALRLRLSAYYDPSLLKRLSNI